MCMIESERENRLSGALRGMGSALSEERASTPAACDCASRERAPCGRAESRAMRRRPRALGGCCKENAGQLCPLPFRQNTCPFGPVFGCKTGQFLPAFGHLSPVLTRVFFDKNLPALGIDSRQASVSQLRTAAFLSSFSGAESAASLAAADTGACEAQRH